MPDDKKKNNSICGLKKLPPKTGLMEALSEPIDDYSDLVLSKKARDHLFRSLLNMKAGLVTISPLDCRGRTKCPFIDKCPIYIADGSKGQYPIGKQCIVEGSFIRDRFREYIEELEEKSTDVENSPTVRSLVSKLVELDLKDYRANLILAGVAGDSDGTLLIDQNIGVTDSGDSITQKQEHPIVKIMAQTQKQRMEILDTLALTPKREIWKRGLLKQRQEEDYVSQGRKILESLEAIVDGLDKK